MGSIFYAIAITALGLIAYALIGLVLFGVYTAF